MAWVEYRGIEQDAALFQTLQRIDKELAEEARKAGCPRCGGPLHYAVYTRAGRGGPPGLPARYRTRWSLCCGREGCRRRLLPPSCLFFGRRWYWGVIVMIASALGGDRDMAEHCLEELVARLGASVATVRRWLGYFREVFPNCLVWKRVRGLISPDVEQRDLPGSLIRHVAGVAGRIKDAVKSALHLLTKGQARSPGVDPFHAEFDPTR